MNRPPQCETIRVGVEHLGAVMTIMDEAFSPQFGEAWTASQCEGMLVLPGSWLLLAIVDQKPAGFALIRSAVGEAELLLIATLPVFQRRKIGEALINRVIDDCRNAEIRALHIEVRADNPALAFYTRVGFKQVGIRKNYYHGALGGQSDAITSTLLLY